MNVTVWNENIDEAFRVQDVLDVHPKGIHNTVKDIILELGDDVKVTTATLLKENYELPAGVLQDLRDTADLREKFSKVQKILQGTGEYEGIELMNQDGGISDELLENTDVLIWWGHKGHQFVPDQLAAKIHQRVLLGMGLILLHSAHHSKLLKQILGTSGDLSWRHDSYERLFCVAPSHPICEGIPEVIELGVDECYSEPFDIPKPDDLLFIGWYEFGNVFRSGCTWTRGYGKIFYFQPGHETNRGYYNPHVRRIIQNGCRWVCPTRYRPGFGAPHIDQTLEELRGASN